MFFFQCHREIDQWSDLREIWYEPVDSDIAEGSFEKQTLKAVVAGKGRKVIHKKDR